MYKYILILLVSFSLYAQNIADIYLVKNNNTYLLSDGDLLLEKDVLKFNIKNKSTKVYYQINDETLKPLKNIDLKNEGLILDDQRGTLTFMFESDNDKETIRFFTNPNLAISETDNKSLSIIPNEKRVYIDQTKIITNDRGAKEANIIIPKLESSTVIINVKGHIGAGAIIDDGQSILTNYHVIEPDDKNVYVAFKPVKDNNPSKTSYFKAKVLKVDMVKDLALLEIPKDLRDKKDFSSLNLADEKTLKKGIDIYNIGHPIGYYYAFEYGMLNNILDNYSWKTFSANKILQYSMNSNRGNSGSPIVNDKLELIGIGAFSNTKGRNLNFAISILDIKNFLASKTDVRVEKKDPNDYKNTIVEQGLYKNIRLAKLDRNNNGIPDAMMKDIDKDGIWDIIAYDTDEDGSYERVTSF